MKEQKKGISLIVLVITIIVMIILASAIIISLSNSNIITKAKEAVLKTDVKNFAQELSVSLAEEKLENKDLEFDNVTETDVEEIKKYIPNFDEKYAGKIFIQNGELVYDLSKVTADEKVALDSIGVKSGTTYTPAEIKAIIEEKNLGTEISTTDITKYVEGISKKEAEKYTIFQGDLYYRYEKTTYEDQLELYNAGISTLYGDVNGDGTITTADIEVIDQFDSFTEQQYPYNFPYIGDVDGVDTIDSSDSGNLDVVLSDNFTGEEYNYKNYIISEITQQHPAYIRLVGDYRLFDQISCLEYPDIALPETDVNTEKYTDMVAYYPEMTEEQAARFKIVNGKLTYKAEELSDAEKSWADEMDIPYM